MDGHGAGGPPNGHRLDGSVRFEGEPIIIANEFAEVEVRKVHTRNGVRLEIRSPRAGYVVRLDALELEALSWQSPETFSKFLENPWGP